MTATNKTNSPVDMRLMETANVWVIREREGRADPAELAAWLNESPLHADAYRRAASVYAAVQAPATKVAEKERAATRRRMVAAIAIVLCGTWLARDVPLRFTAEVTDVGESRELTLADGSHVELNTDSAVSIDYSGPLREVRLKRGEAWFEVTRDPDRPFTVVADDTRVTVLGTKFNVRRTDEGVSVGVAEGRVEVRRGDEFTILSPGHAIVVSGERLVSSNVPLSHVAEWRTGWIGFEHATVGEVIDELSRYRRGPLFIVSSGLRARPISTRLNVRSPEQALRVVLDAASAEMIELPGRARIIF